MIRSATPDDASQIVAIYNHFIEHTVVTFEEETLAAAQMSSRISDVRNNGFPWLVAELDGVAGYAYANTWQPRSAYRLTLETTIYLAPECMGRGLGTELYDSLLGELRAAGRAHCLVGGIALPNPASVALHEKLGFELVGLFKEVGWKLGRWVDVGYWQLVL